MTRDILETITDTLDLQVDRSEVREIERQIQGGDYNDFYAEIDGGEYRFIHEDFIWKIYVEGIKELTQDGYLGGTDLDKHWWIAIDWEKTAENCYDADGYGHHFAGYDGYEYEADIDDTLYYIFRTN